MSAEQPALSDSKPQSVFDAYSRLIRGNVLRGTSAFVNSWSDCDFILRYNRICVYVVTVSLVFLFFAMVFKWAPWLILTILSIITLVSVLNSLLLSRQSCFTILGTA